MRFRIRRAKQLDPKKRELFENCGVDSVAVALGLGSLQTGSSTFPTTLLQTVVLGQQDAMDWLREKRDEEERRSTRQEILEWAILIFVGLEVLFDLHAFMLGHK